MDATRRRHRGLGLALASAATFGTSGSFAGSLLDAGWTPGAAVTVRVVRRGAGAHRPRRSGATRPLAPAARAGRAWSSTAWSRSRAASCATSTPSQHLSVAVALLLEYSGVLLVVGWMWARTASAPRLTVAGAVAAVAGLVLVLDVLGDAGLDLVGVLWGLGAAVGLATYFVLSAAPRRLPPLVDRLGRAGGRRRSASLARRLVGLLPLAAPRVASSCSDAQVSWCARCSASLVAAVVAYVTGILGARLLGAKVASSSGSPRCSSPCCSPGCCSARSLTPGRPSAASGARRLALVQADEVRGEPGAGRARARSSRALALTSCPGQALVRAPDSHAQLVLVGSNSPRTRRLPRTRRVSEADRRGKASGAAAARPGRAGPSWCTRRCCLSAPSRHR